MSIGASDRLRGARHTHVALGQRFDRALERSSRAEQPSREIARQNKELDDGRAAKEKARVTNRAAFRP
jgi:hypothetical protein